MTLFEKKKEIFEFYLFLAYLFAWLLVDFSVPYKLPTTSKLGQLLTKNFTFPDFQAVITASVLVQQYGSY